MTELGITESGISKQESGITLSEIMESGITENRNLL